MPTTEKKYNGYLFDRLTLLERLEIVAKKENAKPYVLMRSAGILSASKAAA